MVRAPSSALLTVALALTATILWVPAATARHAKSPHRALKKPRQHARKAMAYGREQRKRSARTRRLCLARRHASVKGHVPAKRPSAAGSVGGPVQQAASAEPPRAPASPQSPIPQPLPAVAMPAPAGQAPPSEPQPGAREQKALPEEAKALAEGANAPVQPNTPGEPPLGPSVGAKLRWAAPQLHDPIVVPVTASNETIKLSPEQDYIVRFPSTPLVGKGGLAIVGGHNVVVIGGEIDIPYQGAEPGPCCQYGRGLMLSKQTGTIHVEGLYIHGEDLNEGIDLQEPEAIVELENIRIEDVHARDPNPETGIPADTHPDLIQSWSGPRQLLIDGLTGSTTYQGIFLAPNQYVEAEPEFMSMRDVDITGLADSAYLLWRDKRPWPMYTENVWVSPREGRGAWATMWPDVEAWPKVAMGVPPGGSFIPMGSMGAQYQSPGYE